MRPQLLVFVVVLAFSIFVFSAIAKSGGWGQTCVSSENCDSIYTCQKTLLGNMCLCPGTLVSDSKNEGCRIAPGDLCDSSINCVDNAECVRNIRNTAKTCQCFEGMTMNGGHGCTPEPNFEEFAKKLKHFSSSLGTASMIFVFILLCLCCLKCAK